MGRSGEREEKGGQEGLGESKDAGLGVSSLPFLALATTTASLQGYADAKLSRPR